MVSSSPENGLRVGKNSFTELRVSCSGTLSRGRQPNSEIRARAAAQAIVLQTSHFADCENAL